MVPIQIITVDTTPPDGLKREMPRILKEAASEAALDWHRVTLPQAFEAPAKRRHHHRARKPGYKRKKRALAAKGIVKKGGQVDNVFSGATEQSLETLATVRASRGKVTVSMVGPRYITRPVGEEITRFSESETARAERVMQAGIESRIKKFKKPKTTKAT